MMIGSVAESTREPPADLDAVHAREHQVEQHEIRPFRLHQAQPVLAARRSQDAIALALEREAHEALNGVLVVDDEDRPPARAHARSLGVRTAAQARAVMHTRSRCSRRVPLASAGRASRACAATRPVRRARPRCSGPAPTARAGSSCSYRRFVLLVGARTAPALPRSSLPPTFDGAQALAASNELAERFADRSPGSTGNVSAADWVAERLRASGAQVSLQRFRAPDANGRTVPMINVLGVVSGRGRSREALVFIAGRDDRPPGPGANDNASGTGALIELARTLVGSVTQTSLVFASVDGTTADRPVPASSRATRRAGSSCARALPCAPSRAPTRPSCYDSRATGTGCPRRAGCARSSRGCATRASRACGSLRWGSRSLPSSRRSRTATRPRSWAAGQRSSASTARALARAPRSTPPSCSRPTSWGGSGRRHSSQRSRSTSDRARPASVRRISSPVTASCAAGRSSSSSWPC